MHANESRNMGAEPVTSGAVPRLEEDVPTPREAAFAPETRGPLEGRGPAGEKIFVYLIVATLVVFILTAAGWFSERAVETYAEASRATQSAYTQGRIGAPESLTYYFLFARAQDATLVKGGALLASFLVVILGVLMVLEGSKAFYKLNVEGGGRKSALETSSPGLLMITLGLALVYGVMLYRTEFTLSAINLGQSLASLPTREALAVAWPEPALDFRERPIQAVSPTAPEKKRDKGLPMAALVARPSSEVQPPPPTEVQRVNSSRMDVRVAGLQDTSSRSLDGVLQTVSPTGSDGGTALPRRWEAPLDLGAGLPATLPRLPLTTSAADH